MTTIPGSFALVVVFASLVQGQAPKGWRLGGGGMAEHYEASLDKQIKRTGEASGHLQSNSDQPGVLFGNLLQSILASDYRGKRVRLAGYLQTAGNNKGAWMWLRADTPTIWRLDNMSDRLIRNASSWRRAEIVMDIPDDAQALSFGFALYGAGKIWVDDVSLEVVGKDVQVTTRLRDGGMPDERKNTQLRINTMSSTLTNQGFEH